MNLDPVEMARVELASKEFSHDKTTNVSRLLKDGLKPS